MLDREMLRRRRQEAVEGGRAEEVHGDHERRVDGAQHLHHVEGLQRIASIHRHQENIDPPQLPEVLRRKGVVQMAEMGDAQLGGLENEDGVPSYSVAPP